MALSIITADERLAIERMIKVAIFGRSGEGKTSLLWTLLATTTLFWDLEAGDLAVVRTESVANPWRRSQAVHDAAYAEIKRICRDVLAIAERRADENDRRTRSAPR